LGVLAAIALPSYFSNIQQGAAKSAQNNLISIYNAEKSYYFANTVYCTATTGLVANCGNSTANLNTNLGLNITDSNFSYACTSASNFTCTATNLLDGAFTLTVTNASIILPGGTGCTASPWTAPCNPSCAYAAHPTYCPN